MGFEICFLEKVLLGFETTSKSRRGDFGLPAAFLKDILDMGNSFLGKVDFLRFS